jgi:predicted nucleic acid-binding protein
MILLDTNVVSEAMKPEPHRSVRNWLDAQKDNLAAALASALGLFDARILPFDTGAARRYADLAVRARRAGKGFPTPDGYIAAIAAAHGFAVASRDTSAFTVAGLIVIDPWRAVPQVHYEPEPPASG